MRLVIAVAAKFRHYGLPFPDLVSEGNIGLMQAAARFEPERGVRFSTYASWWIRSAIQDYVLRNWSIVRTGTTAAQKSLFFNLRRLRALIKDVGSGALSPENRAYVAQALKVGEDDVEQMASRLAAVDRSLNAPFTEDGDGEWQDLLSDENPDPEAVVMGERDTSKRSAWLGEAMGALSEREQLIIRERRLQEESVTLEKLGERLGISKERVRQIEHQALGKLKKALTEAVGDPEEAGLIPRL
jgi:RNA polymerase sigma-32 factor